MDVTSSESGCDEYTEPEVYSRMLHALKTCARGDKDYGLFFEPSRKRLDLLRTVLLFTDRDGSFECRVSKASNKEEVTECIIKQLTRLNYRRADEFAAFVKGAASVGDQKRVWTLLLETAAYVEKKRGSSCKGKKTHDLTFEPPMTSTPLQSGLPPGPPAMETPKGDPGDLLKKSLAPHRSHPSSSGRELKFASSGEERAALVSGTASLEQHTTMESQGGFSFSHGEPTVIAAGGSLASFGKSGSGDTSSKVSQQDQVPDMKLCEKVIESARGLCSAAESLVERVNARLAADAPQEPRIDFDSAAVKRLYDAACHFELLNSVIRNDK